MAPIVRPRLAELDGDVELDCAGLTFMGAAGINLFVEIHQICLARGAKLTVVNAPRCVTWLLALTELDGVFDVRSRDAARVSTSEGSSGRQPIYSIGAVASMLGVETATLRAWEDRYGVVVPARSKGEQRVYSRDELEQLRFVVDLVASGTTPAAAHRLLADRSRDVETPVSDDPDRVRIVVLLAERDRYSAELLEYFLRTEGYEVCVALEPERAEQLFTEASAASVDHRADDVGRRSRAVCPLGRR